MSVNRSILHLKWGIHCVEPIEGREREDVREYQFPTREKAAVAQEGIRVVERVEQISNGRLGGRLDISGPALRATVRDGTFKRARDRHSV
jgi:hypothetical protein